MEKNKKNIFKIIASVIGYAVIFAMAAVLVLILRGNLRGEVTFIAGKAIMWVKTPSMEPQIPELSYILVGKVSADEVKVGDVIVFRSDDPTLDGAYNTHRVIEIVGENEEFKTKGDNNFFSDNFTAKAENVVGRYIKNLPVLSVFGRVLQNPMGVIIMVTLMFVIMLLIYVPDMIKATKERSEMIDKKRREQIDELVKLEIEKLRAADEKKSAKESGKTAVPEENDVGTSEEKTNISEEDNVIRPETENDLP